MDPYRQIDSKTELCENQGGEYTTNQLVLFSDAIYPKGYLVPTRICFDPERMV